MAWFMSMFHSCVTLNALGIFIYTIYYLIVVGYFMRYANNCGFIVKSEETVVRPMPQPYAEAPSCTEPNVCPLLAERLEEWVKQKKYHEAEKTLYDIESELNTTRGDLNEYTMNKYGVTFRAWRNLLRIDEAKQMLAESDASIVDICDTVGYSDRSNFHRHFTEIVGMTPAQYRKKHAS